MTIHKDSYETSIGLMSTTHKSIEHKIRESIVKDDLDKVNIILESRGSVKPIFVTGLLPNDVNIPLFSHPMLVANYNGKSYLATDLRLFIRNNADIGNIEASVKNMTEYNFVKSRAALNLIWLADGPLALKNGLAFAGTVFAAWLSETISRQFALDFKDQTTLAIISSYFYQSQFTNDAIDEETKQRFAVHTINATKAPAEFVFEIFDKLPEYMDGVDSYCEAVKKVLENVRVENLNVPMLLTMVRNSWYGTNSKEIIPVALEHPPTWMAVVYAAISERTYKNSVIYRYVERLGKRGAADEFIKNYVAMVRDQLAVSKEDLDLEFPEFN